MLGVELKMPADQKQKLNRRRIVLTAAVAAIASQAFAADIKPGDIIFGTSSNNQAGGGRVYVYDPIANMVTPISGTYSNGVGGLALDNNYNIVVGTNGISTSSSGRLYSLNPTTGTSSQLGSGQFFNGVGGLAYDASSGNIYVGTRSSNTAGAGAVYQVNASTNYSVSQVGSTTFSNGVSSVYFRPDPSGGTPTMMIGTGSASTTGVGRLYNVDISNNSYSLVNNNTYFNAVEDIAADRDGNNVVFGTGSNNAIGHGNLYSLNGSTAAQLGGNFLNRVGALAYDFDGQLYLGTHTNGPATGGHLYSVNSSGTTTQINPTNFSADIFNGITSMVAVQPLPDFVGGNNVVIDAGMTSSAMFSQVSPVDGSINWFSGTTSQNININDVYGSLEADDAGVRTGSGLPNNQQGDLTVAVPIDFDHAVTGTPATRTLTLRAADDLTINGAISDGIGTDDSLNLNLYARNARRVVVDDPNTPEDERSGVGIGDSIAGLLDLNAPIMLGAGNLYASGTAFDNAAVGATVTTAGNATLDFKGDVTISQPLYIGGDVLVNAGKFSNTAAGTISADIGVSAPVNSFTLVATAGDVEGVSHDGSVTLDGTILANTFSFKGADFTNNVPLDALTGDLTIDHTGVVSINQNLHSAGAMLIKGSTFNNPGGELAADGSLAVHTTGAITVSNAWEGTSVTTSGTDLTVNAGITSSTGAVTLDQSGALGVNAPINSATDLMINQSVASPGSVSIDAQVDLGSGGALSSKGTTFDTTAPINVTGQVDINHTGNVTVGGAIGNASGIKVQSQNFANTNGPLTSSGLIEIDSTETAMIDAALSADSIDITAANELNSTVSGTLTATGLTRLEFINATLNGDIATGQLTTTGAGITINGITQTNVGNMTLDQTGPTDLNGQMTVAGDLLINQTAGQTSTIDIDGVLSATNLATRGTSFRNTSVLTLSGAMTLDHSGVVAIDGSVLAPTSILINASDFSNSATIDTAAGAPVEINLTGIASINGAITAGSFDIDTTNSGAAGEFSSTAKITATIAGVRIHHPSSNITIGGGITTETGIDINSAGATSDIALNSAIQINSGGSLTVYGNQFTSDSNGTITAPQNTSDVSLNQAGLIDLAGAVDIGNDLTTNGNSIFHNSGTIHAGRDITLNHIGQTVTFDAGVTADRNLVLNQPGDVTSNAPVVVGADFTLQGQGALTTTAGGTVNVAGTSSINVAGDVNIGGAMQVGPMTIDAPNVSTTATINGTGPIDLNVVDAIRIAADVTTTGATSDLTADSVSFDSRGATLDLGGVVNLNQSGDIHTDAITAGKSVTMSGTSISTSDGKLIKTLDGDLTITASNGSNAVTLGGGADAVGNLLSTGSTFNSTGGDTNGSTAKVKATGLIDLNHTGEVTTSELEAGSTITVYAPSMSADGLIQSGLHTTVTATGGNVTASSGVQVGGDMNVYANSVGGQSISTVGGAMNVNGLVYWIASDAISTNDVTATAGPVTMTSGAASLTTITGNISSGNAFTVNTNGLTVTGSTTANGTTTITAGSAPISFGGNLDVAAGNFVSTGGDTFTSSSAATIAGSTSINTAGNVSINTLQTGTTLDVVTTSGSTFTSNDLTTLNGTTNVTAPAGITLNGLVNSNGSATLNSQDGLVDFNTPVNVTTGDLTINSTHFDNADNGVTTVVGNVQFNNNGSINIAKNLSSTGLGTTIGFSGNPSLTIQSGAQVNVTQGTIDFSGGVTASAITASRINSQSGFVGRNGQTGNVTLDGGADYSQPEVIWTNSGNLYVGGSATNGSGTGHVLVNEHACLLVGGTLKVWGGDTVELLGGKIRFSNLDLDNNQGNLLWYSGTINDSDDLVVSTLQPIARVIGQGSGATTTLRVLPDRHLQVNGKTNLQNTLYLDGGTLSTGQLQNGSRLSVVAGQLNLTDSNFYVVPSVKPSGWTIDGTLGNKTVSLAAGQNIAVTGTGRTTTIAKNGLLQVAGGEFNAANGLLNNGTIALQAESSRVYGSGITNAAGAVIFGTGSIDARVTNQGELRSSFFEVLKLKGAGSTSSGTIRVANGGSIDVSENGLSSTGTISGDGTFYSGEATSYTIAGTVGPVLRNIGGTMTFGGKTEVFGDVVVTNPGLSTTPRIVSSGRGTTTSFYGDVLSYNSSRIRAGQDTTNVFYGLLKGHYVLSAGTGGKNIVEGREESWSPGFYEGDGELEVSSDASRKFDIAGLIAMNSGARDSLDFNNRYTSGFNQGLVTIQPPSGDSQYRIIVELVPTLWDNGIAVASAPTFVPKAGDEFVLWQYSAIVGYENAAFSLPALSAGLSWEYSWTGGPATPGELVLSVAAVPEPTILGFAGIASAALLRRRRRAC